MADERGVGVINAAAVALGLLTPGGSRIEHPAGGEIRAGARRAVEAAERLGVDIAFLANQYSIQRSGCATTVIGTVKPHHLDSAVRAAETPIDEDVLAEVLAAVGPGARHLLAERPARQQLGGTVTTVRAATLVAPYQLEVRDYPYPRSSSRAPCCCGCSRRGSAAPTSTRSAARPSSTRAPRRARHAVPDDPGARERRRRRGGRGGRRVRVRRLAAEPGDRVVPAPNRACGQCGLCRAASRTTCAATSRTTATRSPPPRRRTCSAAGRSTSTSSPAPAIFRVPDALPDDVAVLTEIFAVTHGLERAAQVPRPAGFRPGDAVAVIGVGALGLAHASRRS